MSEVKYFDANGDPCSLYELINKEPQWAESRIKEGELAIKHVKALLTENAELKKKVESRENTIAEIREEVFPPEPDEIVDNYFAVKNIQDILTHMKE